MGHNVAHILGYGPPDPPSFEMSNFQKNMHEYKKTKKKVFALYNK